MKHTNSKQRHKFWLCYIFWCINGRKTDIFTRYSCKNRCHYTQSSEIWQTRTWKKKRLQTFFWADPETQNICLPAAISNTAPSKDVPPTTTLFERASNIDAKTTKFFCTSSKIFAHGIRKQNFWIFENSNKNKKICKKMRKWKNVAHWAIPCDCACWSWGGEIFLDFLDPHISGKNSKITNIVKNKKS